MLDSVPTIEAVDQELQRWEAQVARVKANLDLLEEAPTYALISGGLKFSGRTQQEIVVPILAARDLADQYAILAGQVAKARLLRDSLRRFLHSDKLLPPNRDALREIDRLLNQPCVPLPAAQVALAQRNLLDDPTRQSHLSLSQLVEIMASAFGAARDSVTRYDAVMAELSPLLKAAEQRLGVYVERAAALDASAQADVNRVRAALADVKRRALDDPVGVVDGLERALDEPLRGVEARLEAIEHQHASVREELTRARVRQERASRNRELDPAQVADLGEWLEGISRTLEAGQYAPANIGLQHWTAAADLAYGAEERRREQLDLLKALRAMAQRRRERGASIDAAIDGLALEAESLMRQRPADVERARRLIEQYQRAVTSL